MTTVLDRPHAAADTTPNRPPRSYAAWWVVPPVVLVLAFVVYPLIRVCLESMEPAGVKQDSSTWAERKSGSAMPKYGADELPDRDREKSP